MPARFEDEYPEASKFLSWIYRQPKKLYVDGVYHSLPYYLHCGVSYCQHIPYQLDGTQQE